MLLVQAGLYCAQHLLGAGAQSAMQDLQMCVVWSNDIQKRAMRRQTLLTSQQHSCLMAVLLRTGR